MLLPPRPLRRLRVAAAAALAVAGAGVLAPSSPSAAAADTAPIGVQWNAADSDAALVPARMDRLAALGVRELAMPVSWWYVCPRWDSCDFTQLDRTIGAARDRGLTVSLQVNGTPDWLHPDRANDDPQVRRWMLPRDDAERASLQSFARTLSARYAGRVARYEWGNEPDLLKYSTTGISPQDYARSLASFYLGVKAGDSAARVVSAGISRASEGFAREMISTLSSLPGAAQNNGFFDELGLHPYADENSPLVHDPRKVYQTQFGITDFNFDGYRRMLALLDSVGRPGTRIWLSEFGYSTTDTWMKAVPDQQRALYLLMAADAVRAEPRISGLAWHAAYATSGVGPEWALLDASGNGAAAGALVLANAGRVARPTAAGCDASVIAGTVSWAPGCFGVDAARVSRTEVYLDGRVVSSTSGAVATWATGTTTGAHDVVVAYYDAQGPVAYSAPRTVTVQGGSGTTSLAPSGATTGTQSSISTGPLYFTVSGRTVTFDVAYRSDAPLGCDDLVVAVRDASGAVVDPPSTGPVRDPLSYAYHATRTYAPGTYTAVAAYRRGGQWVTSGTARTFDIR